jgi:acyl-CoA synthetase (AMP-forming)/AMP-acid ligase II
MLSHPRPEAISLFLAAASIGAVFQGLNPKHRHAELSFQLADSEPVVLLNALEDRESSVLVEQLSTEHASIRHAAGPGIGDFLSAVGSVSDATLATACAGVTPLMPAALVYTSGSTGRPKGALLPHRGFTWGSVVQAEHWFDQGPGSIICNLPIDHVGAIGNICCSSLVVGGTVVFQERFDAEGVLALIESERVSYWGAVPAMFLLSVRTPRWSGADLSSLRKIIWSGGLAPVDLIKELGARCPRLGMSYGSTETVGEVTFSDPTDDVETLSATIGRPEARYEVRIVRENGSPCDGGEQGEIVVRGDFVMRGYLNQPEATAAAVDEDGWLHTGDLARARPDGSYELVGRTSEMFKSGGYNVYPREIELVLEDHPAVQLAAVVGVPDDLYGKVAHAYVLADPSQVSADVLRSFAAQRLSNFKVPKVFIVATDLPMLPIGKIDKSALMARR